MRREEGFTLVELLVVMLILGLLAVIAIPSFFLQRDNGRDAAAKTAVRTSDGYTVRVTSTSGNTFDIPGTTTAARISPVPSPRRRGLSPGRHLGLGEPARRSRRPRRRPHR
jgi:prepilin-type N-terminal cleavage/methylation domain-containing protein